MILIDSDVLIEHLRGNTDARDWLVQARRTSGPLAMSVITKLDPLAYGVDGLRGVLINTWHFSLAFDMALLAGIAVLFLSAGAYLFTRIEA